METADVYDLEERPGFFFKLVNALNVTVRESVIRREARLLLREGGAYDARTVEELERNLRKLPFIAEAVVTPIPREDEDVDVHVKTSDRFTLRAGAAAGAFGGSSRSRVTLAEQDFFGSGKRFQLTYEDDPDRSTVEARFTDRQFLTGQHLLNVEIAESSDGHDYQLRYELPFRTLASPWSYGLSARSVERDERFFEKGEEIASIPLSRLEVNAFVAQSIGTERNLIRPGFRVAFRNDRWGVPEGDDGLEVERPDDTRVLTVGPTLERDWLPEFVELTQIDAIDYVEDIPIGIQSDADDSSASGALAASVDMEGAFLIGEEHLLSGGAGLTFRQGDEPLGWRASSFLHYYFTGIPHHTLVFAAAADGQWENEDLNSELTLGEDSGLRGYPSRQFSGHKRLRFNIEDRLFTGIEVASLQLGIVTFADAGMVFDRGEPVRLSDLAKSVGIGLRVGSASLFGNRILRIDIGFPLDEIDGEEFDFSISASAGQVIEVFGNLDGIGGSLDVDDI